MVSRASRSFTCLVLLLVTFAWKTWSSLLPNTSLNIESALARTTLSIASGSSNANYDINCIPPLSSRGPFLDKGDCRQILAIFYQRFPRRTSTGQYRIYTLIHSPLSRPLYPIKCPYVIAYPGCVFTLDYRRYLGGDQPFFYSNVAESGGNRVARACVGKAPQERIDGGEVIWSYLGTTIRITLAHTAMPFTETDGNLTSVDNGSAGLVPSAESNLTFSTDVYVPVDTSDSE